VDWFAYTPGAVHVVLVMASGLTFVLAGLGKAMACAAKRIVLTMCRSIMSFIKNYDDVNPNEIGKRQ
jgi:hypothetical protein